MRFLADDSAFTSTHLLKFSSGVIFFLFKFRWKFFSREFKCYMQQWKILRGCATYNRFDLKQSRLKIEFLRTRKVRKSINLKTSVATSREFALFLSLRHQTINWTFNLILIKIMSYIGKIKKKTSCCVSIESKFRMRGMTRSTKQIRGPWKRRQATVRQCLCGL